MSGFIFRLVRQFATLSFSFLLLVGSASDQQTITLVATGSSLPEPLYVAWGEEFHKSESSVQFRYLAEGTAASAERILAGTGDFGGGDAPIPDKDLNSGKQKVVELPSVLIGIAVVYNLPGLHGALRLTGPVVAKIYLGKIVSWRDPEIAKQYENSFAKVELFTIDDVFGGWTRAQKDHFAEGGIFDQIYKN